MELVTQITANLKYKLEKLFAHHKRIDLAIESILEGAKGGKLKVWVDDSADPMLCMIEHGTFIRFAGKPENTAKAIDLIKNLQKPFFVQPSPLPWIQLLEEEYGQNLQKTKRYQFSSISLCKSHLAKLFNQSSWKTSVQRLQKQHVAKLSEDVWGKYHFMNCNDPVELVEKGMAYGIQSGDEIVSCCSSVLVCSQGYEVNIITKPEHRKQGMGTAVAAKFIMECIDKKKEPHWDAANETSKTLARQLGYTCAGEYDLYFVK